MKKIKNVFENDIFLIWLWDKKDLFYVDKKHDFLSKKTEHRHAWYLLKGSKSRKVVEVRLSYLDIENLREMVTNLNGSKRKLLTKRWQFWLSCRCHLSTKSFGEELVRKIPMKKTVEKSILFMEKSFFFMGRIRDENFIVTWWMIQQWVDKIK